MIFHLIRVSLLQVAAPCCSEFLVTRAALLSLPKSFYEAVQEWLLTTPLDSASSGRVLEYMWHIMWGVEHQPVFANVPNCTCYLYSLNCEGEQPPDMRMLRHMQSVPLPWQSGVWTARTTKQLAAWGLGGLAVAGLAAAVHRQGAFMAMHRGYLRTSASE